MARFVTIAGDLHARFAGDYDVARQELALIVDRYFRSDLGIILVTVEKRHHATREGDRALRGRDVAAARQDLQPGVGKAAREAAARVASGKIRS